MVDSTGFHLADDVRAEVGHGVADGGVEVGFVERGAWHGGLRGDG